jgi:hypothetical protein
MQPFAGAYITLAGVAVIAFAVITQIQFPEKRTDPNQ